MSTYRYMYMELYLYTCIYIYIYIHIYMHHQHYIAAYIHIYTSLPSSTVSKSPYFFAKPPPGLLAAVEQPLGGRNIQAGQEAVASESQKVHVTVWYYSICSIWYRINGIWYRINGIWYTVHGMWYISGPSRGSYTPTLRLMYVLYQDV